MLSWTLLRRFIEDQISAGTDLIFRFEDSLSKLILNLQEDFFLAVNAGRVIIEQLAHRFLRVQHRHTHHVMLRFLHLASTKQGWIRVRCLQHISRAVFEALKLLGSDVQLFVVELPPLRISMLISAVGVLLQDLVRFWLWWLFRHSWLGSALTSSWR